MALAKLNSKAKEAAAMQVRSASCFLAWMKKHDQ
jgi:hypothetical protein